MYELLLLAIGGLIGFAASCIKQNVDLRQPRTAKDLLEGHKYEVISVVLDSTIGINFNDVRPHLVVLRDLDGSSLTLYRLCYYEDENNVVPGEIVGLDSLKLLKFS